MKLRHLLLALLLLPSIIVGAQQPWNYSLLDEACTDETYLVAPPYELQQRLPSITYNTSYRISGPYHKLGRTRYRFQNETDDFSLSESDAISLMPYMVSHRYWNDRYTRLLDWDYIDMTLCNTMLNVDTSDHRNGRYSPIVWLGYNFQPSDDRPIYYLVRTNQDEIQHLPLAILERLAEWGAFASYQTLQMQQRQQFTRDSIAFVARADTQRTLDSLDSISYRASLWADSINSELTNDSLVQARIRTRAEVEHTRQIMNKRQLFFFSIKPARSDYMFGLEFNLYNCFPKTITKVEISVAPYDSRMRLQTDKFGRRIREVRCMGPIAPGAPAQYTFDELFWDDNSRIKYLRTTAVTFHFTDGTTRTFSGYNQIMKHCLN